jgi:hypothetical protein
MFFDNQLTHLFKQVFSLLSVHLGVGLVKKGKRIISPLDAGYQMPLFTNPMPFISPPESIPAIVND